MKKGVKLEGEVKEKRAGERGRGKERAEPMGESSSLLVRTRSRGGFHGIIRMFVDVDGKGYCERAEETQNEINVRAEARNQRDRGGTGRKKDSGDGKQMMLA